MRAGALMKGNLTALKCLRMRSHNSPELDFSNQREGSPKGQSSN
jgi:hypothetical protein